LSCHSLKQRVLGGQSSAWARPRHVQQSSSLVTGGGSMLKPAEHVPAQHATGRSHETWEQSTSARQEGSRQATRRAGTAVRVMATQGYHDWL
jgi:hypothetical protein